MVFDQAAFSLLTISYNCQLVNWRAYNESLVRRGEVMLDFDVVDGWEEELEKMNEGKVGWRALPLYLGTKNYTACKSLYHIEECSRILLSSYN